MSESPGSNFCIAPFHNLRQHEYNSNSACTYGVGKWPHNDLSIQENWNSVELNQLREKFSRGEKPTECSRCWEDENNSIESLRQMHLRQWPGAFENFIKTNDWINGPKVAVFKTSNRCNLTCRNCSTDQCNLSANEETDFKKYLSIADKFERISFFGGEPFLNTTHLDLLEYLISKGLSKKIDIQYNTNGTIVPTEKFKKIWDHFRRISITVSLDGIDNKFEYLHWPGVWSNTEKIIKQLTDFKNQLDCEFYIMARCNISLLNVYYTAEIYNWLAQQFNKIYVNLTAESSHSSLHVAPDYVKLAICNQTQQSKVLGYINSKPSDQLLWKQFIIWNKRQDLYRKQDFKTTFPEFYNIIKSDWDSVVDLSENNFLTKD